MILSVSVCRHGLWMLALQQGLPKFSPSAPGPHKRYIMSTILTKVLPVSLFVWITIHCWFYCVWLCGTLCIEDNISAISKGPTREELASWLRAGNNLIRQAGHVDSLLNLKCQYSKLSGENNHLPIQPLAISIIPKSVLLNFIGLIQVSVEFGTWHSLC